MKCKICNTKAVYFGKEKILGQYIISYFRCGKCEYIFTETPFWLKEAYLNVINMTDTGLVARNLHLRKLTKLIFTFFFRSNHKFLDYGGGGGLFVRLMRDAGFDFYWYDQYGENLLSRGFEHNELFKPYEAITAFEVFEHLESPLDNISHMMKWSSNILFTTMLLPEPAPPLGEWWYYGLEHGQHISFYSKKTLQFIAEQFGLQLYSNGRNIHLLTTTHNSNKMFFKLLSSKPIYYLAGTIIKKRSLTLSDYEFLKSQAENK